MSSMDPGYPASLNQLSQITFTFSGNVGAFSGASSGWSFATTLSPLGLLDISGASAGQIKFPATQNASANANTLDDYEEGTFTPAWSATGATFSYILQSGKYTKVGNTVAFQVDLILNTSGNTLTANPLSITGMPFTATSNNYVYEMGYVSITTSYVSMQATLNNATSMAVCGLTAAGTNNTVQVNSNAALHATAASQHYITGNYLT